MTNPRMTSNQVKKVIQALHPKALEEPATISSITHCISLQNRLLSEGILSTPIVNHKALWLAGNTSVQETIEKFNSWLNEPALVK